MAIDVTIKNYRCFVDANPATFTIGDGITAFLGPNNSGKSSLLKLFFELRDVFRRMARSASDLHKDGSFTWGGSVQDQREAFSRQNSRPIQVILESHERLRIRMLQKIIIEIPRDEANNNNYKITLPELEGLDIKTTVVEQGAQMIVAGSNQFDCTFLLGSLQTLSRAIYVPAFRNVVNVGGVKQYYDISIGSQFVEKWSDFQSGVSNFRNREISSRVVEDIRVIFGFAKLDISPSDDKSTLIVNIDENSYRLEELGAGIAHFIVALISVATSEPSYVLIDEPETGLHPLLQLKFVTALASHSKDGLAMATHSYGLARSAADLIYSTRLLPDKSARLSILEEDPTSLSEMLGEGSFSGYRELGFKRLLLVEGRHEIKTFQQFLRRMHKDHEIMMIALAGSTLINSDAREALREVLRITSDVHAVIDSELDGPDAELDSSRQSFVEICKELGINIHVLDRRATENYFTEDAVRLALGTQYHALEPFELLREANPAWNKNNNWRVAREMSREELLETDLGTFLDAL